MQYNKICPICGNEFPTNHPRHKYCSIPCRQEAERKRSRKYAREKINTKNTEKVTNFINKFGEKTFKILIELANQQQEIYIKKKTYCEVCGRTVNEINLVTHHITYSPVKVVTLCTQCHGLLHNNILKRKKYKHHVVINNYGVIIQNSQ